jgi:LysM repeat protein
MQQIERYGVIALLFLLVTIVVVALWDGGDPAQAAGEDPVVQVDDARAKVAARSTAERPTAPKRGTRPQAQAQDGPRASLSRGPQSQDALDQRSRLLNPGGVPADPNARAKRRTPRTVQPKTQPSVQPNTPAPYTAEPRRGRDVSQWGSANSPVANPAVVAADPIPAIRTIRAEPKPEVRTQPKSIQGPIYVVQSGDSLARIARRTLGQESRWTEIRDLNGIKGDVVRVGAKLRLPLGSDVSGTPSVPKSVVRSADPAAQNTASGYYVVRSGDCLSKIAERELGSVSRIQEIRDLNPSIKNDRVNVGSKLRMPEAGRVASSGTTKSAPKKSASAKSEARYVVQ